jgi:hypothetical protein
MICKPSSHSVDLDNIVTNRCTLVVALNISFIPIVYFCYPETRGLSLEQIDHIFYGKGTSTNWLYHGVRESLRQQPAVIVAADPEIVRDGDDSKEMVEARHVENS